MDIDSVAQNADKAVVVLGGGYDTVHDTNTHPSTPDAAGAGVYILDLQTGAQLWRAGRDAGADLQLAKVVDDGAPDEGGTGNDEFIVYANQAELRLEGQL